MGMEENTEILKNAYKLWHDTKGASIENWMSLMDDEVKFMSLAQGALGAEFTRLSTSKTQVGDYFKGLTDQWEMIHYTVDEFICQNDRVVMVGSTAWKNKSTGKSVETPKADIFKFRNGKIIDFMEFYDTAGLIAGAQS